jgi:hypothetical protein
MDRLLAGQAAACTLNLIDPVTGAYDPSIAAERLGGLDLAVIEWARRRQGIMVAPGNPAGIKTVADLGKARVRVAVPPKGSSGAVPLSRLLADACLTARSVQRGSEPARSDAETAMAVASGRVDAGLGSRPWRACIAWTSSPCIGSGSTSLCVTGSSSSPLQKLFSLARTSSFRRQAALLGGYNVTKTGRVIRNVRM